MICKKCGNELVAGSKFCGKCGTAVPVTETVKPVSVVAADTQACPSCGTVCKVGAKFCGKCGHSFAAPAPEITAPPVHAPASPAKEPVAAHDKATPKPSFAHNPPSNVGLYAAAAVGVVAIAAGGWWFFVDRSVPAAGPVATTATASAPASASVEAASPASAAAPASPVALPPSAPASPASAAVSQPVAQAPSAPVVPPTQKAAPTPPVEVPPPTRAAPLKPSGANQNQVQPRQSEERLRDQERAKLQKANKTLDDLLQ